MSVLIKGMKMPESCQKCPMLEGDYLDGLCHATGRWLDDESYWKWGYYDEYDIDESKPLNCPLVEIPPHGRLIDADALEEEPCDVVEDRFPYAVFGHSNDQIRNAPTIIEAEER